MKRPRWSFWSQRIKVKHWEAVLLSCNEEPDTGDEYISEESIRERLQGNAGAWDRVRILRDHRAENGAFTPCAVSLSSFHKSEIVLAEFAEWAIRMGWLIPGELRKLAQREQGQSEHHYYPIKPLQPIDDETRAFLDMQDLWTIGEAIFRLHDKMPPPENESVAHLVNYFHKEYETAYRSFEGGNLGRRIARAGCARFVDTPERWRKWAGEKGIGSVETAEVDPPVAKSEEQKRLWALADLTANRIRQGQERVSLNRICREFERSNVQKENRDLLYGQKGWRKASWLKSKGQLQGWSDPNFRNK